MIWVEIFKIKCTYHFFTFFAVKLIRRLSQVFVTLIVLIDRLSYLSITQFISDLDHSHILVP